VRTAAARCQQRQRDGGDDAQGRASDHGELGQSVFSASP
jgi:hypothetical protein